MGPDSAHQEAGAEPTPQAEVEVTPSQVDAARLIIEIDQAAGKPTPGFIQKIADARPSRRGLGSGRAKPPRSPADVDEPTHAADLSIGLVPAADQAPPGARKLLRRHASRLRRGRRGE